MSSYDTDNTLLFEMLGKGSGTEVFTTAAQSSKDFYCIFFPVDSVISTIAGDATNITALNGKTMNAGQICLAPDYVVVHKDQKDEFIKETKDAVSHYYGVRNAKSHGCIICPLASL